VSLQKKNKLISAHVVVLVFWFFVLFLASAGFNIELFAKSLTNALLIMFGGLIIGITGWVSFDLTRRDGILSRSQSKSVRGAVVSIGDPPSFTEPRRVKASPHIFASRFPWWNEYSNNHPKHADAFAAILGVMSVTPKLPASPVPGGHGGASLIEHSFNVVKTMMEMAPKWSYRGHKNKRGEISFPLLDTTVREFRFQHGDPIVPLAAFAHDIGKTVCYRIVDDGSVREVRKNHDIEGAKLLRSLPEVMDLPWKDRMALLISCEYYHHIGSLPYSTWIDDRARALIELLIAADIETGRREGGVVVNDYEDSDMVSVVSVATKPNADESIESPEESVTDSGKENVTADIGDGGPKQAVPSDVLGSPLDMTYSVLLEPGRVNGTNAANRIAWKHGEWLYISDAKLRAAVAKLTGDTSYNTLPHRGNMHPFTLELMAQLAASGNLLQEFDGQRFSEKRALFTTVSAVPGKTPIENKFILVARTRAFPGLENAMDCKAAPQIVGCSWGEQAAINKNAQKEHKDIEARADISMSAETLIKAAAEMRLPYTEKSVDGEKFLFFEEDLVMSEFPDFDVNAEWVVRKTGGKTGKIFLGVKRQK
jgi:hypothetical protein